MATGPWVQLWSTAISTNASNGRKIQFEDVLGPVLDQGGFATLALVSTGEDLREWIYYAQSEGGFVARFDYAFAGRSVFPIEIHTAHDPQWRTYEEFRAGVREGDGSSS
jgi:hypothetical protein